MLARGRPADTLSSTRRTGTGLGAESADTADSANSAESAPASPFVQLAGSPAGATPAADTPPEPAAPDAASAAFRASSTPPHNTTSGSMVPPAVCRPLIKY